MDVLICNLVQRTEFILTTVPFQRKIRRKGQFEWTDIFVLNAGMENGSNCESTDHFHINSVVPYRGPPLWSSGQSFWLQIQRSRVRFPALPDFLSSGGSGTGSTQPREVN